VRTLLASMLLWSAAVTALAEDVRPDLAFADVSDPNPGTGFGQILTGWIGTTIGVAGVAQIALCPLDFNDFSQDELRRCRNSAIVFGAIGFSIGIPSLVFGYRKRAAQRAWKQRHGLSALPDVRFTGQSLLLDYRF